MRESPAWNFRVRNSVDTVLELDLEGMMANRMSRTFLKNRVAEHPKRLQVEYAQVEFYAQLNRNKSGPHVEYWRRSLARVRTLNPAVECSRHAEPGRVHARHITGDTCIQYHTYSNTAPRHA